ncbi:MAG: winged helix-turn-helix transcriptional regulator [Deltaproteobacteria bacterium]|nr:winged helix-turn-helix transcriptional regulator [Deltaproteobacteria bacterium]
MDHDETTVRCEDALVRGRSGDFREHRVLLTQLSAAPLGAAYRCLLETQLWFAGEPLGRLPGTEELERASTGSPAARSVARRATALAARGAVLHRDRAALVEYDACIRRIGEPDTCVAAWGRRAHGESLPPECDPRDGFGGVEWVALRSLDALARGDRETALKLARTGCRMADSDEEPQPQYLAYIVLARVRRHVGTPHLAHHILQRLSAVAPPAWRPWLNWELAAVGAPAPGTAIHSALETLERGELSEAERAFDRLVEETSWDSERRELDAWRGYHFVTRSDQHTEPYVHGLTFDCPGELTGLLESVRSERAHELGWILARPTARTRRLSGLAVRATAAHVDAPMVTSKSPRIAAFLSHLALAGPEGAEAKALFRRVYGFRYIALRHRDAYKVLVSRARKTVAARAEIERVDGRIVLRVLAPLLLPDATTTSSAEDRMLRLFASGRSAPQQIASRMGISVRTVQRAVKRLTEEGVLSEVRDGRRVSYEVQDTTFHEPTRWK